MLIVEIGRGSQRHPQCHSQDNQPITLTNQPYQFTNINQPIIPNCGQQYDSKKNQ